MSAPSQTMVVTLGGTVYRLGFRWNGPLATWILNIADVAGTPVAMGIPLVTGSNLLAQLGYLGFSGALVVTKDDGDPTPPDPSNFGTIGNLYWLDAA